MLSMFLLWSEDIACDIKQGIPKVLDPLLCLLLSDGHKRRFNSVFLVKRLLNIQIVSVTSYLHKVIFHLKI